MHIDSNAISLAICDTVHNFELAPETHVLSQQKPRKQIVTSNQISAQSEAMMIVCEK